MRFDGDETTAHRRRFDGSGNRPRNGQPVIERYDANTNTGWVHNDPRTGQPLILTTASGIACLYITDQGGSPVGLVTDFYTPAATIAYDPYGVPIYTSGSTGTGYSQNPYLFKGGIQDRASGLVKYGIRWYNPVTGTFTQQDTLDTPLNPANANRYAFAGADPINQADPRGTECSVGEGLGIISSGGGVGAILGGGIGFAVGLPAAAIGAGPGALVGGVVGGLVGADIAGIVYLSSCGG